MGKYVNVIGDPSRGFEIIIKPICYSQKIDNLVNLALARAGISLNGLEFRDETQAMMNATRLGEAFRNLIDELSEKYP